MKLFKTSNFNPLLATIFCVQICSCRTAQKQVSLEAKQDVFVVINGETSKKLAVGQTLNVEGKQPILVESPGYVSTVVLPISDEPAHLTLRLRKVDQWGGSRNELEVNKILGSVVASIGEIQMLLSTRKGAEALEHLEAVQRRHPGLSYLNFLRVSCYIVLGDLEKARVTLKASLAEFPTDVVGLALKKQLLDPSEGAAK